MNIWFSILNIVFFAVVVTVVFVLLFDLYNIVRGYAPSLSSTKAAIMNITKIYDFKPKDRVADFGSGKGRILRFLKGNPIKLTGFEINPLLYLLLRMRFIRDKNVVVMKKDFLKTDLRDFDVIIIYGIKEVMEKLENKIKNENISNLVIISNKFTFKGIPYIKQQKNVYLYKI